MKTQDAIVIHDLAGAARRAVTTEDVIRRWIREGLRATPVGTVGRRGPSDYRIFDSWLVEFLEKRAEVRAQPAPGESPAAAKPRKGSGPTASDPLAVRPKPREQG